MVTLQFAPLRLGRQCLDLGFAKGAEAVVRDDNKPVALVSQEAGLEHNLTYLCIQLRVPLENAVLAPVKVLDAVQGRVDGYEDVWQCLRVVQKWADEGGLAAGLFQLRCHERHHFEQVSHNAVRRHFENRGLRVFVDGDDDVGGLHPGQVLRCARDAAGDV